MNMNFNGIIEVSYLQNVLNQSFLWQHRKDVLVIYVWLNRNDVENAFYKYHISKKKFKSVN